MPSALIARPINTFASSLKHASKNQQKYTNRCYEIIISNKRTVILSRFNLIFRNDFIHTYLCMFVYVCMDLYFKIFVFFFC